MMFRRMLCANAAVIVTTVSTDTALLSVLLSLFMQLLYIIGVIKPNAQRVTIRAGNTTT